MLLQKGIEKAFQEHKCELVYILLDKEKREKYDQSLTEELKFKKIGDIFSLVSLLNNMLQIEVKANQTLQMKQYQRGDFYGKQLFEQENVKTLAFTDDSNSNIYGMSIFFGDKKFSKNFTRFILNSKIHQNSLLIKLFYTCINNIFFMTLMMFERNKENLLHYELKYKVVLYFGLNVGICLAFFQIQKSFKNFLEKLGDCSNQLKLKKIHCHVLRNIYFFEKNNFFNFLEMKKSEIFEILIKNIQVKCIQNNMSQIRVDLDKRCDHLDYFTQKSIFFPYNQNELTLYACCT